MFCRFIWPPFTIFEAKHNSVTVELLWFLGEKTAFQEKKEKIKEQKKKTRQKHVKQDFAKILKQLNLIWFVKNMSAENVINKTETSFI